MKYQNFRGDFTVVETFSRNGEQIPVPEHVIVEYFTKKYAGKIVCERHGGTVRGCRLSDDGMALICSVALSRKAIGMGFLCHNIIEVVSDEDFPSGSRYLPAPEVVAADGEHIMLYDGVSDNSVEVISSVVLSQITENVILPTNNDIVFEKGTGSNSASQKQRSGTLAGLAVPQNNAFSESSITEGAGNTAGLKGYRWTSIDFSAKKITFASAPTGWAVNDKLSIINNSKYPDCCRIIAISSNVVTVDSLPFTEVKTDIGYDAKCAYVSAKPDKGDIDLGIGAHAEGVNTKAINLFAHAEGWGTEALGQYSHAEGRDNKAQYAAHAEGRGNEASEYAHAEGNGTKATGSRSHSEGMDTTASGLSSHAEGARTRAHGYYSHAEGYETTASAMYTHAEGAYASASDNVAHAEGMSTRASGVASHAEGESTTAEGPNSHAEGYSTTASGQNSHAEGGSDGKPGNGVASGNCAHVEGYSCYASGKFSHAQNDRTIASGNDSTSCGYNTVAKGNQSFAEGYGAQANGNCSHAEGGSTIANGVSSHAEGEGTQTSNKAEHAEGMYNKSNTNTRHSVGIGTSDSNRKNAFEIMSPL